MSSNSVLSLRMDVKDFGPITDGTIDLKPMVILVGPNGSGKSHVAKLIHSVIDAQYEWFYNIYDQIMNITTEYADNTIINQTPLKFKIPDTFSDVFHQAIQYYFLTDIKDLVRYKTNKCTIDIKTNTISAQIEFRLRRQKTLDTTPAIHETCSFHTSDIHSSICIEKNETLSSIMLQINDYFLPLVEDSSVADKIAMSKLITRKKKTGLSNEIAAACLMYGPRSFYVPTTRFATHQFYKMILNYITKKSMHRTDRNLYAITGDVLDFVSMMAEISATESGDYAGLAVEIEQNILNGKLTVDRQSGVQFYRDGRNIPMHRVESAVSYLAPLILCLKHDIHKDSLLVIEEPENNLHPGNQKLLAKYLVKLANAGLNIIITTHSPYILETISNLLQASALSKNDQDTILSGDESIAADRLAVYAVDDNRITQVPMSEQDGILQDEFSKIEAMLYNEYTNIVERLENENKST